MTYPDKLLADGEHVEFELRPHWRALLAPIIWLLGVIILGTFVFAKWGTWFADQPNVASIGRWIIALFGLGLVVLYAARPFAYWLTTDYVFTNRRIIVRSGLVSRQGRDMPLSKVQNVSFDVSALGRLLNYGVLTIDSASDQSLVINDVPDVETIQREVQRLHEEDDVRRRRSMNSTDDV